MASEKPRTSRALVVAVLLAAVVTATEGRCQVIKEPNDPLDARPAPVVETVSAGKRAASPPQEQTRPRGTASEHAATEHAPPSWFDLLRSMAQALRQRLIDAV